MSDENDRLVPDFACLEPTYIDRVAGILNLGSNYATLFFRWIPVRDSETGVIKYERSPALYVVQPRSSMLCAPNCPSRGPPQVA